MPTMNSIRFNDSPALLKGVGKARLCDLEKSGISTIRDLLRRFPSQYEDRRKRIPVCEVQSGKHCVVRAELTSLDYRVGYRRAKSGKVRRFPVKAVFSDGTAGLTVILLNLPGIPAWLKPGEVFVVSGNVISAENGGPVMFNPSIVPKDDPRADGIVPQYRPIGRMSGVLVGKLVYRALSRLNPGENVVDPLPEMIREKNSLPTMLEAFRMIHAPESMKEVERARYRFIYEELFLMEVPGLVSNALFRRPGPPVLEFTGGEILLNRFVANLPFRITDSQWKAVRDMVSDISSGGLLNRLLMGDTGSGKSVIAFALSVFIAGGGGQTLVMAPTGLLAAQLFKTFSEFSSGLPVKAGVLTGTSTEGERRRMEKGFTEGEIQVVFGTTALIRRPLHPANLALVVTDEQHRFGLHERKNLAGRERAVHVLSMSATPIPRSLALAMFGDIEMTIIQKPSSLVNNVKTVWITPDEMSEVFVLIRKEAAKGNGVYMVYPAVTSTNDGFDSVEVVFDDVVARLEGLKVEKLHGGLDDNMKESVMARFREGDIDVLVTTTIVELGLDVPRATMMIINNADRFGLAQLHQLRGRVGRGSESGLCILVSSVDKLSPTARKRLETVVETSDGFILAENDLAQRGPGSFFDVRQHGVPDLKMANLITDAPVLEKVISDAVETVRSDPELAEPGNKELRKYLKTKNLLPLSGLYD